MDTEQRIAAVSSFLLQSPPGEINDVLLGACRPSHFRSAEQRRYSDVRMIIDDDEALQDGLAPALRSYNTTQLIAADVSGVDHQVIISDASRLPLSDGGSSIERFVDPRSKQSFEFDHIRLEASNTEPYEPNSTAEPFRLELEKAALIHLADHYYNGVAAVLSQPLLESEEPAKFIIQLVGNKYNPSNYWYSRSCSQFREILKLHSGQVAGDRPMSLIHRREL